MSSSDRCAVEMCLGMGFPFPVGIGMGTKSTFPRNGNKNGFHGSAWQYRKMYGSKYSHCYRISSADESLINSE